MSNAVKEITESKLNSKYKPKGYICILGSVLLVVLVIVREIVEDEEELQEEEYQEVSENGDRKRRIAKDSIKDV